MSVDGLAASDTLALVRECAWRPLVRRRPPRSSIRSCAGHALRFFLHQPCQRHHHHCLDSRCRLAAAADRGPAGGVRVGPSGAPSLGAAAVGAAAAQTTGPPWLAACMGTLCMLLLLAVDCSELLEVCRRVLAEGFRVVEW